MEDNMAKHDVKKSDIVQNTKDGPQRGKEKLKGFSKGMKRGDIMSSSFTDMAESSGHKQGQ